MNGAAWRALRAGTPGQARDTSGVSSLNSPPSAALAAEGVFSPEERIAALEFENGVLRRALAKFGQAHADAKARGLYTPSLVPPEFFDQARIALKRVGWRPVT